ncbi:MAG: SGNH/GDSL hydrolase family protein [Clostridia bacterium]
MNVKFRVTVKILASLLVFVMLFLALEQLLVPKYTDSVYEGQLIQEYYDSDQNNQVLFIGDCEVYENFSPITLWEEYGITSYIRGGPQQLIWQSYYLLEDTLQYETPDVVVFNVLSMKYDEPQSEAYNRLNIDGMEFSQSKIDAINASMTEEESFSSYIFPILRYHDRITELTWDDFIYYFDTPTISYNGYLMQTDVKAVEVIPEGTALASYEFGETSYMYLDMITELCTENDIELILIKAPSIYPYWYEQWDEQMVEYAAENELLYINFLDYVEEIGIDYQTDTYDSGLHLNVYGAEKMSDYFGEILQSEYGLENLSDDEEISNYWESLVESYYQERNEGT